MKGSMNDFLKCLDGDSDASQIADSIYNSAIELAQESCVMAAQATRILEDLYYGTATPIEDMISRDEAYADAYFALRDARRAAVSLELSMETQLSREGLERTETGYPEGASDALKEMIADGKSVEVSCQFCDAVYHFTTDELQSMLDEVEV